MPAGKVDATSVKSNSSGGFSAGRVSQDSSSTVGDFNEVRVTEHQVADVYETYKATRNKGLVMLASGGASLVLGSVITVAALISPAPIVAVVPFVMYGAYSLVSCGIGSYYISQAKREKRALVAPPETKEVLI